MKANTVCDILSVNLSNIFFNLLQFSLTVEVFGLQSFSVYAVKKHPEHLCDVRHCGSAFIQSLSTLNVIFGRGLINPRIDLSLTTLHTHHQTCKQTDRLAEWLRGGYSSRVEADPPNSSLISWSVGVEVLGNRH